VRINIASRDDFEYHLYSASFITKFNSFVAIFSLIFFSLVINSHQIVVFHPKSLIVNPGYSRSILRIYKTQEKTLQNYTRLPILVVQFIVESNE
jgi:hypothetical protein